ncbi:hypothetical protein GJ496_008392 [Pomphorhynchus laevis]|nr:hypothetical protein GJ496_008392 [Pomphorhynchus laevis]
MPCRNFIRENVVDVFTRFTTPLTATVFRYRMTMDLDKTKLVVISRKTTNSFEKAPLSITLNLSGRRPDNVFPIWAQIPKPRIMRNALSQLHTRKRGRCLHKIHHTVDSESIPVSYDNGFGQDKTCRDIQRYNITTGTNSHLLTTDETQSLSYVLNFLWKTYDFFRDVDNEHLDDTSRKLSQSQ